MPLPDKNIRALVYATDNIEEASRLLRRSLSPMGRAGYSIDAMKPFDEKIESIRAELSQLQKDIFQDIYK